MCLECYQGFGLAVLPGWDTGHSLPPFGLPRPLSLILLDDSLSGRLFDFLGLSPKQPLLFLALDGLSYFISPSVSHLICLSTFFAAPEFWSGFPPGEPWISPVSGMKYTLNIQNVVEEAGDVAQW